MKFLVLIYGNPESRKVWDALSDEQKKEGMAGYAALHEALAARGELVASESLDDPAATKQVLIRDGLPMTTDGPFAEVKEQLAGFYLLDCDSMDRAVEIVGQIPEAPFSIVEVRPVRDLSAYS
ncbi:YciI family protein [Kribbella capetownensis]|uniref:YciI family protein n=1 Tax=Kribbella capetownensis TaxID=1572659 RepID=A0A4R0JX19_9ACTN|nr:YciI family protein [Kribbella capetownensis]TCC49828.1 YciI family protein [Kribbella capetownensis]